MRAFLSKISVLSFLAALVVGVAYNAAAFLLPPGPFTITGAPLEDVSMTLDYAAQVANNTSSAVTKVKQEQTKIAKSVKESVAGTVEGFMPTKKEKNKDRAIPGTRKIAKCKIADIEKPSSVKKAFYKLFLAYPSDKTDVNDAYRQKAYEFYQDTVVETYVSARELEKTLDELEKRFQELTPSLVTGEDTSGGSEKGDDNNGTWKNNYTAYDTMNELLKITEELAAMRAQLEAAYAVRESIPPASKKKSKKSSFLDRRDTVQFASSSVRQGKEILAFAQLVDLNDFQAVKTSSQPVISSNGGASITSFAKQKQEKATALSRQEAIGMFSTSVSTSQKASVAENTEDETSDDYEYDPTTASLVSYTVAPLPKISSPFDGNEEKMEELNKLDTIFEKMSKALEIHNLIQSLPSYKENASKYNRFKQLHDKSVEMLRLSDKCVLQYLNRYYTEPEKVWTGGPISDENTANYDLRTGISAWAINAFEIAKAEKTAGIDSDDGIVNQIEVVDTTDLSKREENEKKFDEENKKLTNPSDTEKTEAINRETELVAWKIGAEAAKKLAEDQYSSSPKWGTAKVRFPIWNDQRNFYNQYIDGKYNNIKEYISALQFNKIALDIAQDLNNILTKDPEVKAYNAKELSSLAGFVKDDEEEDEEENNALKEVAAQKQAALESAKKSRDNALKPLEEQKNTIKANIDAAVDSLNNFNNRINQLEEEKLTAQSDTEDMQVLLEQADDVAAYGRANGEEDTGDSVAQSFAKESIKASQEKKVATEPEISRNKTMAKTQEEKIEELKKQLSDVEEKIKKVEEDYVKKVQEIEEQFAAAFEAARQKIRDSKAAKAAQGLLSIYRENVERTVIGDLIGTASVKGIISKAEGLIDDTKNYAVEAIEKARSDIYKLGDELYLPGSSPMVVKRHAELMDELQNIPPEKLMESISLLKELGGASGVTQALSTLFQTVITQKACSDGRCQVADEEYFIGLQPKDKDFAAPKAAPEMYMPPAREVVRFDTVSYDNVPQTTDGIVSKDGFLNYGEEIPLIWQKILQEDIFVEQGVNLSSILEAGSGREANFMRGGRYPCRLDDKIIDIDPYDGQYMVVSEITDASGNSTGSGGNNNSAENLATREFLKKIGVYIEDKITKTGNAGVSVDESKLPMCQEIELIGNQGLGLKFFYTIRDIEADTEGPAAVQPKESIGNPSELGTLLKAVENGGLRFTDKVLEVFERLKAIEKEQNDANSEYKTNLKDEIFNNAPYNINQIGDFLNFVEVEITYRQALEELAASLKEANDMLKEQLTEAGFAPSDDFDISKEEDYELARNNLDMYKNELVEESFEEIKNVDASDNEVVEERLNKIKRIFTALRKDKDELISLNENSPSDSELDEQIKTEEVNKSVVGEYDKKVEEEFQKQLNNFKRPFCAAY